MDNPWISNFKKDLIISKSYFRNSLFVDFNQHVEVIPGYKDLLALFEIKNGVLIDSIGESTVVKSSIPANAHPTMQQVKGSGFAGAGSATVTGLLTTDTITATGDVPACTVNGTLTFGADYDGWDIYVHRSGVLWAYWPGINISQTTELDASGNGHHLVALTTTAITERLDGTGTDYCNESGFSARQNLAKSSEDLTNTTYWGAQNGATVAAKRVTFAAQSQSRVISAAAAYIPLAIGETIRFAVKLSNITISGGYVRLSIWESGGGYPNVRDYRAEEFGKTAYIEYTSTGGFPVFLGIENHSSLPGSVDVDEITATKGPAIKSIFAIGDSITRGAVDETGTLIPSQSFTNKQGIQRAAAFFNAGVDGDTLAQMDARFAAATKGTPDVIYIGGGANDLFQAVADPTAAMQTTLDSLISKAAALSPSKLVLFGIPQIDVSAEKHGWRATHNAYRQSVAQANGYIYVDMESILSVGGSRNPLYYSYDDTHPNAAGNQAVTDYLDANVGLPSSVLLLANRVQTTTLAISGRQPAGYQSITDNQGPLRRDLIVTAGDTYPGITVTAPLGPKFQAIAEWTNNAAVDLSTFESTENTGVGQRGVSIHNPALDTVGVVRRDNFLKPLP